MAAFEYQALDVTGRSAKGVIEGDGARQARALLRERGLTPLRISPIQTDLASTRKSLSFSRGGVTTKQLALITRQFATLFQAGLTIEECLNALIEQNESDRARRVLAGVRARILEGQSLSKALGYYPRAFPETYRNMIDSGEQSGRLDRVLEQLADYTENRETLQQRVLLAFIYPALIALVAAGVVIGLLAGVVPKIAHVFASTGQYLPLPTRLLISISDIIKAGGWWWPIVFLLIANTFILSLRIPHIRWVWHHLILRIPVFGRLIRNLNAERFANTLGILTASGVNFLQAMRSAAASITNLPMHQAAEQALREVREGGSLSASLKKTALFPPIVVHLIASGEASGKLDTMLMRAAQTQSKELENTIKIMMALLEPILVLIAGAVVLFIVLSIMLPIFEINQLIK